MKQKRCHQTSENQLIEKYDPLVVGSISGAYKGGILDINKTTIKDNTMITNELITSDLTLNGKGYIWQEPIHSKLYFPNPKKLYYIQCAEGQHINKWLNFNGNRLTLYPDYDTYYKVPWKLSPALGTTDLFHIQNYWRCDGNEPTCFAHIMGKTDSRLVLEDVINPDVWSLELATAPDIYYIKYKTTCKDSYGTQLTTYPKCDTYIYINNDARGDVYIGPAKTKFRFIELVPGNDFLSH